MPDSLEAPLLSSQELPLRILAEAVDSLRAAGFISLKTLSSALDEAVLTGSEDATRFARTAFQSLDGATRRDISEAALRQAIELATRHAAGRGWDQ